MTHSMSNAREIAYDAYAIVMATGRDPDEVVDELAARPGVKPLRRLDRNFIKEIVFGSLRWHSKIYWILQNTSKRDLAGTSAEIRAALVCGTYQIFYMDRVPDRAAVNESAEYIRIKGQAPAVSFVNGILRQIARRAEYFAKPNKTTQQAEYLALQFAHPQWMVERWLEHFKFDRLEKMLAACNQPPPWTVRLNGLKVPAAEAHSFQQQLLREERTHSERTHLRGALVLREAPNLDPESLFARGYYTIQDEASQLIAHLVDPQPDQVIVDAAAGPGGKLSHLFELSGGKARILGVERGPEQAAKARETLTRLGHQAVEVLEADFLECDLPTKIDRILLDAPCSGLGVLRRHPEGKWHKKPSLVTDMAAIQRRLIERALGALKPGGELIYSVCSAEPEEGERHCSWIKEKYGDKIEMISPVTRLPDYFKRYVTRQNLLLIYMGNQDGMDGFTAFILRVK